MRGAWAPLSSSISEYFWIHSCQTRSGKVRSGRGEVMSGQVMSGLVKSGQVRLVLVKSRGLEKAFVSLRVSF